MQDELHRASPPARDAFLVASVAGMVLGAVITFVGAVTLALLLLSFESMVP